MPRSKNKERNQRGNPVVKVQTATNNQKSQIPDIPSHSGSSDAVFEKKDLLTYIAEMYKASLTYHNHKEVSAWAGIVFLYAVIPLIIKEFIPLQLMEDAIKFPNQPSILPRCILATLIIFIVGCGVARHLKMQLILRRDFGNMTLVTAQLSYMYLFTNPSTLYSDFREVKPEDIEKPDYEGGHLYNAIPPFVRERLKKVASIKHPQREALEWAIWSLFWAGVIFMVAWSWSPYIVPYAMGIPEREIPQPQQVASQAYMQQIERGRYLVKIAACNDCHTPGYVEAGGKVPEKDWLTGERLGFRGPWGTLYPINLRLYMQSHSEDQWVTVSHMPWLILQDMTEQDLRAIYQFIRNLGPGGSPTPSDLSPDQEPPQPYIQFPQPPK